MSDTVGPSSSTPVPSDPQLAAAETLRLATAYQASRALHVALRMSIPDLLADSPRSLEDLARNTCSQELSLGRLLRALAAYGVLGGHRRPLCARTARSRPAIRWAVLAAGVGTDVGR